MEDEKPPPYAQYHCSDASVKLTEAEQPEPQASSKAKPRRRCTAVKCLAVAVTVFLITTVAASTLLLLQQFEPSLKAEHLKSEELPDVSNLTTAGIENGYITLSWQRPQGRFHYYSIEVIQDGSRMSSQHKLSLCANNTIIHPDRTQLTCGPFEPCTNLSYTMRTHLNGPLERSSPGVTVKDIFIPAEVPPEVTDLQVGDVGVDTFVLTWERPKDCFDYYIIEVIDENTNGSSGVTCNDGVMINPNQTSVTCNQTKTCSNVTIRVLTHTTGPPIRCSTGVALRHVYLEGKAPPDVTDLKLLAAEDDTFTISFQVPYECFDVYAFGAYVTGNSTNVVPVEDCDFQILYDSHHTMTCTGVQTCDEVDLKVWTRRKGPPDRDSAVSTLQSVNIRGKC